MTRPIRDISASVKQRLLNVAHGRGEEFEQVLVRYVAERFLYRLSKSDDAGAFLLKGAMLFVAWEGMPHRVTRDIDLLGFGDDSLERMTAVMREIAVTAVEDDGLVFDVESVQAAEIRTIQDYGGVRVSAMASLGKARIRLQVDLGFGDAVTPGPEDIEFPALIDLPRAQPASLPRCDGRRGKGTRDDRARPPQLADEGLLRSAPSVAHPALRRRRARASARRHREPAQGADPRRTSRRHQRRVRDGPGEAGPVAGLLPASAVRPARRSTARRCRRPRGVPRTGLQRGG